MSCEWCAEAAVWWFKRDGYVRYSCDRHQDKLRRLIFLDLGVVGTLEAGPCAEPVPAEVKPPWQRSGYRGWDVTVDWSKVSMVRTLRAMIQTRSFFTDSFTLASFARLRPRDSVFMRVFIPEGCEDEFDRLCEPVTRKPAARAAVNDGQLPEEDRDGAVHGSQAPAAVPGRDT